MTYTKYCTRFLFNINTCSQFLSRGKKIPMLFLYFVFVMGLCFLRFRMTSSFS